MMRLRLSTLLLFLFPALTVLVLVSLFNTFMLNQISSSQAANERAIKQIVFDLHNTMLFIEEVGTQYNNLNELLITTDKQQLTQAQAYRIQSRMVDDLAKVEREMDSLQRRLSTLQLPGFNIDEWHQKFDDFKNFAVMASDIVVIDANTARTYIHSAQKAYFQFVTQSNKLSNTLSVYSDYMFVQIQDDFKQSLNTVYFWGTASLLIALLVAILSALRLSGYLRTIMTSLRSLASYRDDIPRLGELRIMLKSTRGELHQLANAVLKFKRTLELNKEEEQQIFQLAFYDELTKLPNMQMLKKELQNHLIKAKRNRSKGILIKLNINGFKVFNNALGYDFGDQLLMAVAKRLQHCTLENNLIFRGSSDEFFILIEPIDKVDTQLVQNTSAFGETIQHLFSAPLNIQNEQITVTLSQGIVCFPDNTESSQEVIRNAMIAMHNAKALGNNRYVVYNEALSEAVTEQFTLLKDLESALENDELTFYLQSQVHSNNTIPRAEALIRWNHPTRGWIRPDIFIGLAEQQSNLIITLDKWMLTQVCNFISEQAKHGIDMRISINISGHHFAHPHFLNHVQQVFEKTGVNPQQVTLELTESVFLNDFADVINKMKHLKALGAHFSIDDFGTGYSSLNYLKRLPVNEIKVDQTFVRNITSNKEDWTLVKAVFEMAQTFNLEVVVEGVETKEQEAVIQQFGSAIIQGYLYAKPIPHQEWLENLPSQHSTI
ncbi:diguanylate cyclase [uncultured Thiomicrorhabdus sp.]